MMIDRERSTDNVPEQATTSVALRAKSRHLPHLRSSADAGRADDRTRVSQGFKRNSVGMHGQKRLLHQPIELLVWEQTLTPDNRITNCHNSESHGPSCSHRDYTSCVATKFLPVQN